MRILDVKPERCSWSQAIWIHSREASQYLQKKTMWNSPVWC